MSTVKLSTDCDRVICAPLKIQTLPYSQAVELHGPDMVRSLDVCQEAYTVRIRAKSDIVAWWRGPFCSYVGTSHITTAFAWVQSCFLFVLTPPGVVSWLLFVCWCAADMYLWLGTFEHELLNLGCWRSWLSVWGLLIWWVRWLHENVVAGATLNRCELLPQKYAVWAIPAQPPELTVVCYWRATAIGHLLILWKWTFGLTVLMLMACQCLNIKANMCRYVSHGCQLRGTRWALELVHACCSNSISHLALHNDCIRSLDKDISVPMPLCGLELCPRNTPSEAKML